jgi:ankyrin repeat protein
MGELHMAFLNAARRGDEEKLRLFVEEGFPVSYQDRSMGDTALHILAAGAARKGLRVLLKSLTCDFLVRDKQGRLPSELAYLYGRDPAVARLLGIKERKQAAEEGIKLTRRPRPDQ